MNADTPLPGDSGAPLNLDARVPCAFCGAELLWRVTTDDDDVVDVVGWCSSCPSEWDGPPAPVSWRTLATSGDEVPAAYVARLVAEVERLTAERDALAARVDELADRVTAAEGRLELAHVTPGPHISPALLRRVEALGFVPGSGEPVGWLVGHAEDLAMTLANERGEGEPPSEGWASVRVYGNGRFSPGWRREDTVVARFDVELPWRVFSVDGTAFSPVHDADGRPASAPTAREAIRLAASLPPVRRLVLP